MKKNALQVLSEQELLGKKFKIYGTYEEPLFLAKDVAEWIGHSQVSKMLDAVDDEEKLMGTLFLSGQKRNLWMLKENGVYEVIMQSRKPIAKTVKKQFKAILHSVRVHGGYLAGQETMTTEQIMAQSLLAAQSIIDEKNKLIAELEPKGAYYDKILRCKGLINTTVIAKDYGMSAKSFNKMLHEYGIQYKQATGSGFYMLNTKTRDILALRQQILKTKVILLQSLIRSGHRKGEHSCTVS